MGCAIWLKHLVLKGQSGITTREMDKLNLIIIFFLLEHRVRGLDFSP